MSSEDQRLGDPGNETQRRGGWGVGGDADVDDFVGHVGDVHLLDLKVKRTVVRRRMAGEGYKFTAGRSVHTMLHGHGTVSITRSASE